MKDKKKRKEILNKIASPKQIKMLKFIKDKCDVKFKEIHTNYKIYML